MRTTLAIDDDILAAARHLAEREGKTLGEAVSALARQGLLGARAVPPRQRNGLSLLPLRDPAVMVTPELVQQLRDELA